tara:strand:+ start:2652 stop:3632 length:981 start_codon:yes stop_codon:yes gene_type:complete
MFNAIVEEEEEKSEIEIDDDKSKELKEKLAQSIEDFSSELKETLTQSLKDISTESEEKEVKVKKPIWSLAFLGITFSISLMFSMIMSVFVYFNAILGIFPGGLLGESQFGDKFYYYVFFEKVIGTYPDSTSAVRPTWEFAGALSLQDFLLLGLSALFLFLTFVKLELRGFRLFSEGELKENVEEGSDNVFKSSKILIMITLLMYILTVIGAVVIDNRIDESETFVLGAGEDLVIELESVHTISWQIKVLDVGENSSYSMLVLDEFNCERLKEGNTYSSEDSLSKEDLVKSSAINPKRVTRDNYCAVLISDELSESSIELKYTVIAE